MGANMPVDPFKLERFVAAQVPVYDEVRRELQAGSAQSLDLVHLPATARSRPQCNGAPLRHRVWLGGTRLSGSSGTWATLARMHRADVRARWQTAV